MSSSAKAGEPVRRDPSVQSLWPLEYWVARSSRTMTIEYDSAFSRLNEPELCIDAVPRRGSRECRVLAAPAVSCAKRTEESAHEHTGTVGTLRHSLRNGFTAYSVLSPENGSFASVAPKKLASRELDASTATSGPHDFAVRFMRVRLAHSTSTASHRTFVTIAKRPSFAARRADSAADLPDDANGIFLREGMDRVLVDLPVVLICRSFLACHSGTRAARARNPSGCIFGCEMDSGFALRAPRNDERESHNTWCTSITTRSAWRAAEPMKRFSISQRYLGAPVSNFGTVRK